LRGARRPLGSKLGMSDDVSAPGLLSSAAGLSIIFGAALYLAGMGSLRAFEQHFGIAGAVTHDVYEIMWRGFLPTSLAIFIFCPIFLIICHISRSRVKKRAASSEYLIKWGWEPVRQYFGQAAYLVFTITPVALFFSISGLVGIAWGTIDARMSIGDDGCAFVLLDGGRAEGEIVASDSTTVVVAFGPREVRPIQWSGVRSVSCGKKQGTRHTQSERLRFRQGSHSASR